MFRIRVDHYHHFPKPHRKATRLLIVWKGKAMATNIPCVGSIAEANIIATDDAGNPAPIERLVASISDPDLADVGCEGTVLRVLPKGKASALDPVTNEYVKSIVQVTGDAILGEGESLIVASTEVYFTPGIATHIQLGDLIVKPAV